MTGYRILHELMTIEERSNFMVNIVNDRGISESRGYILKDYVGSELMFITSAFPWESTPEGCHYWVDVSLKVHHYCNGDLLDKLTPNRFIKRVELC